MRSRTGSRPWSRCRLTLSTPPISRANASRRARSSSSGFQFIRILRLDNLVIVVFWHGKGFRFQPIAKQFSVGAVEQAADRGAEFAHLRCDFPVQALLVIHRGQKTDRDHHEGLILRRPQRYREAVDVWTPQTAGDDIAMFTQEAAVVLRPGPPHFCPFRKFAFPFPEQYLPPTDP